MLSCQQTILNTFTRASILRHTLLIQRRSSCFPAFCHSAGQKYLSTASIMTTSRENTKSTSLGNVQDPATRTPTIHKVILDDKETKIKNLLVRYCSFYDRQHEQESPGGSDSPKLITRITGGWVRDKLLGIESHDLDIAMNLVSGHEFAEGLNNFISDHSDEFGIEPKSVHKIEKNPEKSKHLETATTQLYGLDIDFVNLRSEAYAENSNIPKSAFGTAEEDAYRRDATLNALFYNLQDEKVEDFTGRGLQDLERGILRTPLPRLETFTEDPLRVIRMIRFATTLGFQVAPETLEAMQNEQIKDMLRHKISKERVGVEISKALVSSNPQMCLSLIESTGLFHAIFNIPDGYTQYNSDNYTTKPPTDNLLKSLAVYSEIMSKGPSLLTSSLSTDPKSLVQLRLWLAVILNPWEGITVTNARQKQFPAVSKIISEGIKLSSNDANTVTKAMTIHETSLSKLNIQQPYIQPLTRKNLGLLIRQCGQDWKLVFLYSLFKDLVEIPEPTNASPATTTTTEADVIFEKYANLVSQVEDLNLTDAWQLKPILNGKEISKMYGSKGGQWLAQALQHLVEYQLESPEVTKEEAIKYMEMQKKKFLG